MHYHEQYRPLSRFRMPPSAVAGTPETHEPRGVLDDLIKRDGTAGDVIGRSQLATFQPRDAQPCRLRDTAQAARPRMRSVRRTGASSRSRRYAAWTTCTNGSSYEYRETAAASLGDDAVLGTILSAW